MNIFTIIFLQNFSKIFSKTHEIAPFLKIFSGEHSQHTPEPPSKRVASPRAAWRFAPCKYPHFYKKNLNPPPEMKSWIRHCTLLPNDRQKMTNR